MTPTREQAAQEAEITERIAGLRTYIERLMPGLPTEVRQSIQDKVFKLYLETKENSLAKSGDFVVTSQSEKQGASASS